ncbi:hypothetical protein KIW84_054007 [Lathyrus oleraceus]|uniref:Uncharacterized protein n=1 Tax=Pisum sativum TaxID=3888 RepID=A0A9D4WU89_PEA|nr:hypothetical protein KIW84_054007 [Pisum sativum]
MNKSFSRFWWGACLFDTYLSVLVNGSPAEDFVGSKGIRQGDPLSLFLFAIVGEGWAGLVSKAKTSRLFKDQLYVPQLLSFQQELSSLGLYR